MEKGYKIAFNEFELSTLNLINEGCEANEMRISLQKLYHHILKATDLGASEYVTTFKVLYSKLAYKKLKGIKLTSLKERIYKLRDLGLIKINKVGKKNSYKVVGRICNPTKNTTDEKPAQPFDITKVEGYEEFPKERKGSFNKDIDSNSKTQNSFDYSSYIENREKVTSFLEVLRTAKSVMKEMRVKSDYIKSKVLGALEKNWKGICKDNIENYIKAVVVQKRQKQNENWNKYIAPNVFKRELRFTNYTQRKYTAKDFEELYDN